MTFLKNLGAAVLGYVGMAVFIMASFSLVWLVLGPDRSFQPGSWDVSSIWLAASLVLGLLAGVAGGWLCGKVQADMRGLWVLLGIVVVAGVAGALLGADAPPVGARPDDVSMLDATNSAQQPTWLDWLNPVLGVVGALYGARKAANGRTAASADE